MVITSNVFTEENRVIEGVLNNKRFSVRFDFNSGKWIDTYNKMNKKKLHNLLDLLYDTIGFN